MNPLFLVKKNTVVFVYTSDGSIMPSERATCINIAYLPPELEHAYGTAYVIFEAYAHTVHVGLRYFIVH